MGDHAWLGSCMGGPWLGGLTDVHIADRALRAGGEKLRAGSKGVRSSMSQRCPSVCQSGSVQDYRYIGYGLDMDRIPHCMPVRYRPFVTSDTGMD